jgi:DNA/RNA endonuclease YhcR with UshA esterase domain
MKEKEFKKKCERIRELKAIIKNATKELDPLKKELSNYANANDIEGEKYGIKFQHRHTFNKKDNVAIAEKHGLEIPFKSDIDYATLRKRMENKNLDIVLDRSVAILL